ncbi:acyl transferase/acyl hydrolase/lysophospholipase [Xylariaceae sp. AK1471]|nr:acyl transferase/acyl hydrolase/lysophospholipase [Xylariaceae sp. AK1471]
MSSVNSLIALRELSPRLCLVNMNLNTFNCQRYRRSLVQWSKIAIVDLLASWSVRLVTVVGHSSGEMAAAYASGHMTATEAIAAAYFRGQAVSKNKRKGAMLAVGLDAVEEVSGNLTKDGVFNRVLRTSGSAYHSHHMLAVGSNYIDMLQNGAECLEKLGPVDETQRYPRSTWVSSVKLNSVMADGASTTHYWRAKLESPWTRHCTGLIKIEISAPEKKDTIIPEMDPRFPASSAWYDKFADIGLGYGETFRALSEIQADPHRNISMATVTLNKKAGTTQGEESRYPLHQNALDAVF